MKIIRISGRSFVLRPFTIWQTTKIISLFEKYEANDIKDIPKTLPILLRIISIALSKSLVEAYFKRRRLRKATTNSLLETISIIIENIPASEFYAINQISKNLQTIIKK